MKLAPVKWFGPIVAAIFVTNIAVLFDIPVLRQISGFVFLTFIPGFLFLSILKLNRLGLAEKIVLSVGLSVAFSMFFGVAIGGLLPALGHNQPLSTTSLLASFSTATIIMAVIAYMRNKDTTLSFSSLKLTTREKALLIVPSAFPLLSIIGMRTMNLADNNSILMLLLIMIPAYGIFVSFSHRETSGRVYPIAIFLISVSLLLMYSLRSTHIIGSDTHRTYFMFLTTMDNLKWSQLGFGNLDSALSITVLPAVYQAFLSIDPEYLFKILCSLIVSVVPLASYLIAKKYIGNFYAFLASLLLMSQITFLWTPSYARVNIAILFFALAIMVMFNDSIGRFNKTALFIIFSASIIVSHYGVTYVTFFALIATWFVMQILSKIVSHKKGPAAVPAGNHIKKEHPYPLAIEERAPPIDNSPTSNTATQKPPRTWGGKGITAAIVALFFAMLFLWYSEVIGSTFSQGVRFVSDTFANWQWFLGEDVGGQPVQAATGKTLSSAIWPQRIEFVFSWLTIILIVVGLLTVTRKFKTMVSTPFAGHEKPTFLLKKFEAEYLILSIVCCLILAATVILPQVSEYYGTVRTYFQMTAVLSIFFVIGVVEIARYLKSQPQWILLAVLIPYFLCTTGVTYEAFGDPKAITLSSEGPLYSMYVSDAESDGAKWIREYGQEEAAIYARGLGLDIVLSQGKIPGYGIPGSRLHAIRENKKVDGYIYLRYLDIVDDKLVTEYPDMLAGKGQIYANGKSKTYR